MSMLVELIAKSQAGDQDATEQLVKENAGLIWAVARRFVGRGTELDDLYQLGCLPPAETQAMLRVSSSLSCISYLP